MSLKEAIRTCAYDLGADLVGFGDIDRCRHAPPMMSPRGLLPSARTVIVMAVHHPDACVEQGGERHPQVIGPYSVQYLMNARLDEMAYRVATFLERQGHGALPVASSNIWRYNAYKDLEAVFAPDISHIYMAVVAGLAEIGFSGLALTPEYGARNRFITVLTDAEVEPDPLVPPGSVCDRCMLCRTHCPAEALSKEIDGEKVLRIGPHAYRFPNKNLWRCAWGEHFDLDLDLDLPEVVTEAVILETAREHGVRAGEMGQCLKVCVPKPRRTFNPAVSSAPMRRYPEPRAGSAPSRADVDRLLARPMAAGVDELVVSSAADLRAAGIDPEAALPGARSAVTLAVTRPPAGANEAFRFAAEYQVDSLCYDLARGLEGLGHRSLMTLERSSDPPDPAADANPTGALLLSRPDLAGRVVAANAVLTCMALPPERRRAAGRRAALDHGNASADLAGHLADHARALGADLVGVAPAARLDELVPQLRPVFEGDRLDASDRAHRFTPWDPEVTAARRTLKTPADWLPGARSVLVLGLRYHRDVLARATRPPAEAVGPYAFETYVTNWLATVLGMRLVQRLALFGHRGVVAMDLVGAASTSANPRGPQPDLFANRFAGLAAGLGTLTVSGLLATPGFGLRQRLVAVVTDADLAATPLAPAGPARCDTCDRPCVAACPARAITDEPVTVTCEGRSWTFRRIDAARCDWAKRYALMGESGFRYLGSEADVAPPETITPKALAGALRQLDPIKRYRPAVAEPCVIRCPLGGQNA